MTEVFRSSDISYLFICLTRFLRAALFVSLNILSLVEREVLLCEVRHNVP